MANSGEAGAGNPISEPCQRQMRNVGASAIRLDGKPVGQRLVDATDGFEAIANPQPYDPRRAALRKEPEAIERERECGDPERIRKRIARAILSRAVHMTEEVQRQVHPIGAHPGRLCVRLDRDAHGG